MSSSQLQRQQQSYQLEPISMYIERLPATTIDYPIAWCEGKYIGGLPKNEFPEVTSLQRKLKLVSSLTTASTDNTQVDMTIPAQDMSAPRIPIRKPYFSDKCFQSHHAKRTFLFDRRVTIRKMVLQ